MRGGRVMKEESKAKMLKTRALNKLKREAEANKALVADVPDTSDKEAVVCELAKKYGSVLILVDRTPTSVKLLHEAAMECIRKGLKHIVRDYDTSLHIEGKYKVAWLCDAKYKRHPKVVADFKKVIDKR